MSIDACAALVERGDPDRFLATMAAPPEAREPLWPLYAYNLELARAPWASREPMIAEMRLQWWIDTIDEIAAGRTPRAHEVAAPLADLMRRANLDPAALRGMAEARIWDVWHEPFADEAALLAHLDATAGNLMWLAAVALGAPPSAEATVRDFARGAGLAAWFRAVPEFVARSRHPLPAASDPAMLARTGLAAIARARRNRSRVPRRAAPALFPGWLATTTLHAVQAAPASVATGLPLPSEFARRGGLLWRGLTGRW